MGALYGEETMISRSGYTTMVSDGIDIDLYAGFSAISTVSVNSSIDYNVTATEIFNKYAKDHRLYSRGASPPIDGDSMAWMADTLEEPYPYAISVKPINFLPIEEYISPAVLNNLGVALEEYCPLLIEEGELSSCDVPPPDPPLPKPRTWTEWSNVHDSGHELPTQVNILDSLRDVITIIMNELTLIMITQNLIQECDEGQYIEKMQWGRKHYGLDNLRIKCSGENSWNAPFQNWSENGWEDIMDCSETGTTGFRQVNARDVGLGWDRIVNVRAFCLNSQIEIRSNDDMAGSWNKDLKCGEGQQFVGVHLSYLTGHGFENFKWLCA